MAGTCEVPTLFNSRKEKTMKKMLSLLGILAFSLGLTACNTMQGMGQDIESGGKKLEGAAERQQNDMQRR